MECWSAASKVVLKVVELAHLKAALRDENLVELLEDQTVDYLAGEMVAETAD